MHELAGIVAMQSRPSEWHVPTNPSINHPLKVGEKCTGRIKVCAPAACTRIPVNAPFSAANVAAGRIVTPPVKAGRVQSASIRQNRNRTSVTGLPFVECTMSPRRAKAKQGRRRHAPFLLPPHRYRLLNGPQMFRDACAAGTANMPLKGVALWHIEAVTTRAVWRSSLSRRHMAGQLKKE